MTNNDKLCKIQCFFASLCVFVHACVHRYMFECLSPSLPLSLSLSLSLSLTTRRMDTPSYSILATNKGDETPINYIGVVLYIWVTSYRQVKIAGSLLMTAQSKQTTSVTYPLQPLLLFFFFFSFFLSFFFFFSPHFFKTPDEREKMRG